MTVSEGRIRRSGKFVDQYNDATAFWLYDDSYLDELRAVAPDAWKAYRQNSRCEIAPGDRGAKRLLSLARDGKLLCVRMQQDGGTAAEVICGRKPTRKELSFARWHPPVRAFLSLPSGRLCVEGGNALRLLSDEEPELDSDILEVKRGEYFLDIYFIDEAEMRNADLDLEEPGDAPEFILSLIQGGNSKAIEQHQSVLAPPQRPSVEPTSHRVGKNKMASTLNTGGEHHWFCVATDKARVEKELELEPGDIVRIELESGYFNALFIHEEPLQFIETPPYWESLHPTTSTAINRITRDENFALCYFLDEDDRWLFRSVNLTFGKRNYKLFDYLDRDIPVRIQRVNRASLLNGGNIQTPKGKPPRAPAINKLFQQVAQTHMFTSCCDVITERGETTLWIVCTNPDSDSTGDGGNRELYRRATTVTRDWQIDDVGSWETILPDGEYVPDPVSPQLSKKSFRDALLHLVESYRGGELATDSIRAWTVNDKKYDLFFSRKNPPWKPAPPALTDASQAAWCDAFGVK